MAGPSDLTAEQFAACCRLKRFHERMIADESFRTEMRERPAATVARYGFHFDPDEIRPFWDGDYAESYDPRAPISPLLRQFQQFSEGENYRDQAIRSPECASDPRYVAWRLRQRARCDSQFSPNGNHGNVHGLAAFELSQGCSVGCWFCGVSAAKLSTNLPYTAASAALWRGTLGVMRDAFGPATKAAFCYWATDPLDNPDYERFCTDFARVTGIYPQTTTARPLCDPPRIRTLLVDSYARGCKINRFSILTLKTLDRVHAEYTPEELAHTELLMHMRGATTRKAPAGRARDKQLAGSSIAKHFQFAPDRSIACISGFLYNMLAQSVQLISPCPPDDRWPKGYRIYDEAHFTDADELAAIIESMVDRHMPLAVRPTDVLRFRRDVTFGELPTGFQVSSRFHKRKYENDPSLIHLGRAIDRGTYRAEQLAGQFVLMGIGPQRVYETLNQFLQHGILDDEPQARTEIPLLTNINRFDDRGHSSLADASGELVLV